jgi:hypothetical protein
MLGINISLDIDARIDEELFIKIIDNWEQTRIMQDELVLKYGVAFDKIDELMNNALVNSMVLLYGKNKADVIEWYIYESKDENGKPYALVDPKTKKEYIMYSPKNLYEFLKILDDLEGNENLYEDESDDENDDE